MSESAAPAGAPVLHISPGETLISCFRHVTTVGQVLRPDQGVRPKREAGVMVPQELGKAPDSNPRTRPRRTGVR
ncbi:hypothetical protein IMZ11_38625 [Microtetraspora sp. AC03309]|uniref:hypothetical protein n=1 Tax=Microtetraspora sp. AC03309 TaxID=2779376 RepID=UPI001E346BE1|nr:hypothetical protein [Microtetraspora sp. AC03309]MCC5581535.1 hypothetical protein [Microtetraspora sp. AC03309]